MDFGECVSQGVAFLNKGDEASALKMFLEARDLQPGNADIQQMVAALETHVSAISQAGQHCAKKAEAMADSLAVSHGLTIGKTIPEVDKTIAECAQTLKRNPDDASVKETLVQAYYVRGLLFQSKGEYARAIEDYSAGINYEPDAHYIYEERGWVNLEIKNYNQSIADYKQLIQLRPDDNHAKDMLAGAYQQRGYAYHQKGDYVNAIADYEIVLKSNPDDSRTLELYNITKAKM